MSPAHRLQLATAIALLSSLAVVCAARQLPADEAGHAAAATKAGLAASGAALELTNATLAAQLAAVASPEKCIIFTTTSAFMPELLNMTRNWFYYAHKYVKATARGLMLAV